MKIKGELEIKEKRIRNLLSSKNLDAIILSKQSNFLWFTCGKSNRVILNDDISLVYLLITPESKYLIATNSDSERVMNEELKDLEFELVTYRWYNETFMDAIKKLNIKGPIGSDFYYKDFINIEDDLAHLRVNLTDNEKLKLRSLCKTYTTMLTDFCSKLHPGLSEIEIAGMLTKECISKEFFPVVLMVGSDERIFRYRHPVPTYKSVEKYLLLATVVEQYGLNVSISRSIYFGSVPENIKEKISAVNYVEATYCANSLPGIQLRELLEIGKKAYEEVGHPEEWKNHTQGGIIGYKPREFLVTENNTLHIIENNAMSWNPTIAGAKAEDVILVKKDGIEQLSIDNNWPLEKINIGNKTFLKPKILEIV